MGDWFGIWDTPGKSGRVRHVYVFLVLKVYLQKLVPVFCTLVTAFTGYIMNKISRAKSPFVRDPRVIRVAKWGIYQA